MLASLYVGTMTNVPDVAKSLTFPHLVFLQVFSTLSLIVLSIAGYLAKTKSETKWLELKVTMNKHKKGSRHVW
ncbi:MAG: hypothetical protein AUJ20_12410 [Comamonadaceae bacterium CG1_02_60_18]|nr:MAG: hypothetical protein AUJ20_12410 [Comamonadaceae bacterium CG1_02_60_18]PIQ50687.1 MAG: hypothetical protein COW02_18915 [Comamonadaceae bacterium CG12_big_fil_rev_8_21_14_0_65_59_15]